MAEVTGLYQYPIKGLSAQPVAAIVLQAGQPFPFDRVFALARPGAPVSREAPVWAKKGQFVMLMLDEGLASVRTHLDETTDRLSVFDGDHPVLSADLKEAGGRAQVEALVKRLAPRLQAAPTLVRAQGGHFMDKPQNVISLINLATVRALEQQFGYRIDPLRFRANIYVDGAAPWQEFDWVGSDIRIGGASFTVTSRNGRCAATNVDPVTGRRDLDIPGSLRRSFGHKDVGIYLVARTDATLAVGDLLDVSAAAMSQAGTASAPFNERAASMCRGCYFVYDEAHGAPAAGIQPGTRFADIPAAWRCPDCGTDKSSFESTQRQSPGA
jgi:GntR family transcriptional regulator/MocR family aminotransferase